MNGKWSKKCIRLAKFLIWKKSDVSCNEFGRGINKNSLQDTSDFLLTGKQAAKRHFKKDKSFFMENVAMVNEIIALTKERNAKVIFYTSPAYKTYTSQLNKKQLQKTISTIKAIASLNPNVSYYNFLNDTSFTTKDFSDADHLNGIGAEKFSIKMDSIILNFQKK